MQLAEEELVEVQVDQGWFGGSKGIEQDNESEILASVTPPFTNTDVYVENDIFGLGPLIKSNQVSDEVKAHKEKKNKVFLLEGRMVQLIKFKDRQEHARMLCSAGDNESTRKLAREMEVIKWKLGFYGNPDSSLRIHSWNLLRSLSRVDDFNEILHQSKKNGENRRAEWQYITLGKPLDDCRLREVSASGQLFTRKNNISHDSLIVEKLDRVVANDSWRRIIPHAAVFIMISFIFYHYPMMSDSQQIVGWQKGSRRCRFENF
ncbi:hypothetical protein ACFE04_015149 [Oxalis oulophora]